MREGGRRKRKRIEKNRGGGRKGEEKKSVHNMYNLHSLKEDLTSPSAWGKDVAGPAPTSPLRHSVPH